MPLKRTTRKESFALHTGARALGQRTAHPSRLGQVAQEVVTLLGEGSLSVVARKHIEDQQFRIVRQRELMAKYERDNDERDYHRRAVSLRRCRGSLLK